MPQLRTDPVIVLGVHHSGTSVVSEILHRHGIFMQANMPHWESKFFTRRINNEVLLGGGDAWARFPLPAEEEILAHTDQAQKEIARSGYRKYVQSGYDGASPWGFKDPRSCLTLPALLKIFPNARLLHVVRAPLDVARSLVTRPKAAVGTIEDQSYWLRLWEEYIARLSRHAYRHPQYFEFRYETMCESPANTFRQVFAFVDVPFTNEAQRFVSAHIHLPRDNEGLARRLKTAE
jgi:hypothetical protein